MEYALHLSQIADLPADPRRLCGEEWQELLPPAPLRAVYFGSEFCEDLLPSPAETERFCAWAAGAGIEPVLLTSIVTPRGLAAIERLLQHISSRPWAPTLVVNDWGVLSLLRRSYPELRRRGGRLLNRALRDPRLVRRRDLADGAGDVSSQSAQPAAPQPARLHALLRQFGVEALENDADLDGLYLAAPAPGFARALHFPFVFAATGRNCLVKADGAASAEECFTKGLGRACAGLCRDRQHRVTRGDTDRPLWRSGNTLFYQVLPDVARRHLAGMDRVILYERPTA